MRYVSLHHHSTDCEVEWLGIGRPPKPWCERFYGHIVEINGCWIWDSCVNKVVGIDPRADPVFTITADDGIHKSYRAARFIYEREVGPIPDGYQIDHKCEDWRCVNWAKCLEPVTNLENNRRYRKTRASWTLRNELGQFAGRKEVMPR